MSKNRKTNRKAISTPAPVARRRGRFATIIVTGIVIGVVGFGWWRLNQSNAPSAATMTQADSTAPTAAQEEQTPSFQTLVGKWLRPDGGYVLDIKSVDATGKMDAAYLNPKSINISKAQVSQEGASLKVFVELRDVNYPGSTYDLTYDPQDDQFKGIYYHAGLNQRFEVSFVRVKQPS